MDAPPMTPQQFHHIHSEKLAMVIIAEIVRSFPILTGGSMDAVTNGLEDLFERIPDQEDRVKIRGVVSKLIRLRPRHVGAFRKKEFLRIALRYLDPETFARAYLLTFPAEITRRQERDILRFLIKPLGLEEERVKQLIERRAFRQRIPTQDHRPAWAW